jgi:NADH dehydrogenase FAD-containing subunit
LSPSGFVQVNGALQVNGYPNIFAAGDLTDLPVEKLAQGAQYEANIVIDNIRRLHTGKQSSSSRSNRNVQTKTYKPSDLPMLISLGKFDAIFVYGRFVFCGLVPALLKEVVEFRVMAQY